jgi:hypothetical protein
MEEQVKVTMDILKKWGCLKDLSQSDIDSIEWQLNHIGESAIADCRRKINQLLNQ